MTNSAGAGIWQGKSIRVRARYVPRFVRTTASIDVFLDEQCVLRTGGQFKLTGSHSASFTDGGAEHRIDLTWGNSSNFSFPYQLHIDGVLVADARVAIENPGMIYIPAGIIAFLLCSCLAAAALVFLFVLGRSNAAG